MLQKFHGNGDLPRPNCLDFCPDAILMLISCTCTRNDQIEKRKKIKDHSLFGRSMIAVRRVFETCQPANLRHFNWLKVTQILNKIIEFSQL